MSLIDFCSKLN